MKKFTQKQIKKILEDHKHWLNEDCAGWENMRAKLSNADLSYADLSNAYLGNADLSNAKLSNADLSNAYLGNANLSNANLSYANLSYADLSYADLSNAKLRYADLSYADLRYAKEIPYIPMICPEEDNFIGWKKANNKIIKLHIPANARRTSATTRKCRCDIAEVVEIYNLDGSIAKERQVASDRDSSFIYEVGKTVEVKDFDENRWTECTKGIHFFINRQEAINYNN